MAALLHDCRRQLVMLLVVSVATPGCTFTRYDKIGKDCCPPPQEVAPATCGPAQLTIEEPCDTGCLSDGTAIPPSPDAAGVNDEVSYWDLSLEQAIGIALQQSEVLRDLGATVLRSPDALSTVQTPAIAYTDPLFGEEAALSEFDAQLLAVASFENNDRVFNNAFFGNDGVLVQDLNTYNFEVQKRAATGTQLAFRNRYEYIFDNSVGNRFGNPSGSWTTIFEGEVRQPLLQGAGLQFNRIAGPSNQPGVFNGVLLSRVRTDVSLAEFEAAVRDLISNVENAYWDLYFSYYDLQAKKVARDRSLELWRLADNKLKQGKKATIADVAQALEQYWRFESDVRDSLHGRLTQGTITNNGTSGGTFQAFNGGVRVAERRLRLIMGLPPNSYQLIRPGSYPTVAPVQFDWDSCALEAIDHRAELRRQRWVVKQRELELIASRNFLSPRLDLVGQYRFRGFGNDLLSQSDARFNNAFANLTQGDNQEWQLGVELDVPIGFRRAHAGVRNAELLLAREQALLKEQERTVLHGLSNAFGEVRRAYDVLEAQWNLKAASKQQANVLYELVKKEGRANTDVVLEAERRAVQAAISYHQAAVDYALALRNVHFEKGTLLAFNNVSLAESASDIDAYRAARSRRRTGPINYLIRDLTISRGKTKPGGVLQTSSVSPSAASFQPHIISEEVIGEGSVIEGVPTEAGSPSL